MSEELDVKETAKIMEERLDDWIEKCFAGKIDEFTFFILTALNQYDIKFLLNNKEKNTYIGLIIECVFKGNLSIKEKQQVKTILNKIKKEINAHDSTEEEKKQAVSDCEEQLEKLLDMVCKIPDKKKPTRMSTDTHST